MEKQKSRFRSLDEWFLSPQGLRVAQSFYEQLLPLKDVLHGETILQLTSAGQNDWLKLLRYQHKWIVSPQYNAQTSTFLSAIQQLPIDRNSLDCVIAPLSLEAFQNAELVLDEMDRILKPMGYMVIFGIHPLSLWGLWLKSNSNCFGHMPGTMHSLFSTKRTLSHRGYIQCHMSSFGYIPPVWQPYWIKKLEILNQIGKMMSLLPAGFYCLVMQKYQEDLLPIGLKKEKLEAINFSLRA